MRNDHKDVFARGSLKTLKAEGSVYAYERKAKDGKTGIVALNSGKAATVTIPVEAKDGTVFKDQLSGKKATVKNNQLTLTLDEHQALMMLD